MSKLTQYARHLTVVAAVTLLAQCAWAEATTSKVISFNFSDQSGSNATDTSGVYNVAAGAWNNFSSNGRTRTGDLNMWNGSESVNAGSNFSITWSGSGWWGCGATDPIQKRYLDDGKATTITVSNIPFEAYDVYIICSTDQGAGGKFTPWTVNGAVYGDAAGWGNTESREACVINENTLKIAKQAGTLSIVGSARSGDNRGCVAALQIVEAQAVVIDKNVGSAYTATEAEALDGDIFNLTFDAGATLTLDADLTRQYNLISEGAISVVGDHVTAANLAKLGISGVAGGVVRVIDTAAIPEGLTAPTTGWIYRYEGTTALAALPFNTTASFSGTVEVAAPVTVKDGDSWAVLPVHNNKNYVFAKGAVIEANSFQTGNGSGSVENFVQNGGSLTVNSDNIGNTTSAAFLLAHWGSTIGYTLNDGSISVPNGGIRLGWDGNGTLTQNGGTVTVKGLRANRDGHSGRGIYNLNGGTLTLGANGIDFGSTGSLVLAGGTLALGETATLTLDAGLSVTANSTIEVAEGKTATVNATISGSGAIIKVGAGILDMKANRPTMDVQSGKVKLAATSAEIAAGYIDVPVVSAPSTPSSDKVIVVNGEGDEITVTNVAVVEGNTIRLTLQVNKAITEGGNISELAEGMSGSVLVMGDNEAETPIVITFNEIPEAVTEVILSGTVQIAGTLSEKVKFDTGATIITTDDRTIANTSSGAIFRVDSGTLKMTGTSPAMITVNEGATFDVNGVSDTHYPITLNGGTLKNGGAAIPIGKQQWKSVTLTADSFVETNTEFGMIAGGYGAINFQTNGHKLTKKGTGNYIFAKVTFKNGNNNGGAIEVLEGSIEIAKETAVTTATPITGAGKVLLSGGGSVDLGSAKSNITQHFVVTEGTGTLKWTGDGSGAICSNDSKTDPFITIRPNTTLNIYGHDYSGWNGALRDTGWIVNNGTLVFQNDGGSRFWREHIIFGSGSTMKIDHGGRCLLSYGGAGAEDNCQYMLSSGAATIQAGAEGEKAVLYFGNDGTGGWGDNDAAKKATGFSVGEDATLTISCPIKGNQAITKHGAGTLVIENSSGDYNGAVTLKGGSIVSAITLNVTCDDANMKLETSDVDADGYITYSLVQRDATDIYLTYADRAYGYVLGGGAETTPIENDVIVVDSAKYTDNWHVGQYTELPDMTGHTLKLVSEMNFKGGGFAANQTVVVDASVYLYGNIGAGAAISGTGTLYLGHEADTEIGDGVEISCGVGFQGTNKATINGAVTISGTITMGNGLFKLASGATLTCAQLDEGKVTTDVEGKVPAYAEGKYSLVDAAQELPGEEYFSGEGADAYKAWAEATGVKADTDPENAEDLAIAYLLGVTGTTTIADALAAAKDKVEDLIAQIDCSKLAGEEGLTAALATLNETLAAKGLKASLTPVPSTEIKTTAMLYRLVINPISAETAE